jgi:hypothetical protein
MKKYNLQTLPLPLWVIAVAAVCSVVGGFIIDYFIIDFLFGNYFPKEDKVSLLSQYKHIRFFV